MLFRCQAEPTRCGEVETARIARQLSHDEGEITALEPLLQREKGILRVLGRDMDNAVTQMRR